PHHRVLPSFPTRRSSDLRGIEQCRDAGQQPTLVALESDDIIAATLLDGLDRPAVAMNGVGCDDAALQRQALQKRDRRFRFATSVDRKSTRLNSSHVKISY